MQKLMDWLDKVLTPVADALSNNKYLRSISNGLVATMPLTMIASIFYMINSIASLINPNLSPETSAALLLPYNVLFGILALVISFTVAFNHAKNYDDLKQLQCGLVSLIVFIIIAAPLENRAFSAAYLGYSGIFTAVLVGLLVVELYHLCIKYRLRIKMPDSVPPLVGDSFEAMIPLVLIMTVFYGGNVLLQNTTGKGIPDLIASIVTPAVNGSDTLGYFMILHFFMQLFFWMGMHGWAICAGFSMPISMQIQAEQAAAYAAGARGADLPHIGTGAWSNANIMLMIPLLLMFACKAQRNKSVGKMALVPSIFGISEPYTFGTPIVLNPILGIPFILYQPILCAFDWLWIKIGLWTRTTSGGVSGIPAPISTFLATGDFRCFITWALDLEIAAVIFYPFIKVWDKKCLKEEEEQKAVAENN